MIEAIYRILKNLGFTDPLHPPIVHIPIGLVIGAFVFFAIALIFKRKQLVITARHVSILALVSVFPSLLLGVFDWIHFYHAALTLAIRVKIVLAAFLILLLVLGIVLGNRIKLRSAAMMIIYTLSFVAVVGLGYFGASLIYGKSQAPEPSAQAGAALPAGFEAGKALFADNCSACHPGGGNTIVASLPVKGSKRLASQEQFERFLRAPAMPDGKAGEMPAYGTDALSAAQAKALFAYTATAYK